jgi:hypothetical protein
MPLGEASQFAALGVAQVHPISWSHPCLFDTQSTNNPKTAAVSQTHAEPRFTARPEQYLTFIHAYTCVIGRQPAEADMQQRFFGATPPTIHQMVLTLERAGLIQLTPAPPVASGCWSRPTASRSFTGLRPTHHTRCAEPLDASPVYS